MMALIETLSVLVATVACVWLVFVYVRDNRWHRVRTGRAIVFLAADIAVILGYATLKRAFGWPTIGWIQMTLYLTVALSTAYLAGSFTLERRDQRRAGQRTPDERAVQPLPKESK